MYTTYSYYSSHFNVLTEDQYSEVVQQATDLVDLFTRGRAENVAQESYKYKHIQQCECALCNKLHEQSESSVGAGVTSVSNDGYSESYAIATESDKQAELKATALNWLSGTGLMGVL